jgi:hypothetical protein
LDTNSNRIGDVGRNNTRARTGIYKLLDLGYSGKTCHQEILVVSGKTCHQEILVVSAIRQTLPAVLHCRCKLGRKGLYSLLRGCLGSCRIPTKGSRKRIHSRRTAR